MADLQRDGDSTAVVSEQINTAHHCSSDSSTNSIMGAGIFPSAGLQWQSGNFDRNLIINCAKEKKKKKKEKAPKNKSIL